MDKGMSTQNPATLKFEMPKLEISNLQTTNTPLAFLKIVEMPLDPESAPASHAMPQRTVDTLDKTDYSSSEPDINIL